MQIKPGGKIYVANKGEDSICIIDCTTRKIGKTIRLNTAENKDDAEGCHRMKPSIGPHNMVYNRKNQCVYTVNTYNNSMSIIDVTREKVLGTVFAGSFPIDIDINQECSAVYISNTDSNTVSIVNVEERELEGQLDVGVLPQGISFCSINNRIAVANMNSNDITVIDLDIKDHIFTIPTAASNYQALFSKDGKKLYVSGTCINNGYHGMIAVINTAAFNIEGRVRVGKIPVQMCIHPYKSIIYVADTGQGSVSAVDINKGVVLRSINTGDMAHGICIDGRGSYVYVTNMQDNTISVIDTDRFDIIAHISVGKEPDGIIFVP